MNKKNNPYIMVLPSVLILVIFLLGPVLAGLFMSLNKTKMTGEVIFVGWGNYKQLIQEGDRFANNMRVSLSYVVSNVLLTIPMSYITALLITRKSWISGFFRSIYLIPWITAPVVSTLMVRSMLDPDLGIIHQIVKFMVKHDIYILNDGGTALIAIILHSFWRSYPFIMLFLAAGISTIPDSLYEASKVDGAGKVMSFFHITLPMTLNQLCVGVLMITIWTLHDSESIYAFTKGGPGYSTEALSVRLFKSSFVNFDLNMGSTIGVILIFISLFFMFFYLKLMIRGGDAE